MGKHRNIKRELQFYKIRLNYKLLFIKKKKNNTRCNKFYRSVKTK